MGIYCKIFCLVIAFVPNFFSQSFFSYLWASTILSFVNQNVVFGDCFWLTQLLRSGDVSLYLFILFYVRLGDNTVSLFLINFFFYFVSKYINFLLIIIIIRVRDFLLFNRNYFFIWCETIGILLTLPVQTDIQTRIAKSKFRSQACRSDLPGDVRQTRIVRSKSRSQACRSELLGYARFQR